MGYASLFLALCFVASCSTDQDPDPANTGPDPDIQPDDGIISETIGTQGGVLEMEGLSLTIPSGAFSSDVELKAYPETENYFEGPNISPIYKIEGLPTNLKKAVQFRIKTNEKFDTTSHMAMGTTMGIVPIEDPVFVHLLYPATFSKTDTIIEFQLENDFRGSLDVGRIAANSIFDISPYLWVAMRKNYTGLTIKREATNGAFKCKFPVGFDKEWVREGIEHLTGPDFGFRKIQSYLNHTIITKESIWIYINKFGADEISRGRYIYEAARTDWMPQPIILINSNYVKDKKTFIAQLSSMYYMYMMEKCDKNVLQPDHFWLHEAVASFIGNVEQPVNLDGKELNSFSGLIAGAGNSLKESETHGQGMSPFIKYIRSYYKNINQGDNDARGFLDQLVISIAISSTFIEAINDVLEEKIEQWWPDYINTLISGDIYEIPFQEIKETISETYSFDSNADSINTFSADYPDLSGKLYRLNLNDNFSEDEYLSISVTGDDSFAAVYKLVDDQPLEFLNWGKDLVIKGLPDLAANGDLLLVISNSKNVSPYTGKSTIDCTVERKKSDFPFNYCEIVVKAKARYDDDLQGVYDGNLFIKWKAFGIYEDGLFKADYRPDDNHVITMEIEIDPVKMSVLDFHASETEKNEQTDYTDYDAIEGSGKEFIGYKLYASRQYHIQGEETGAYIDLITSYNGTPGFMTDLLSVSYDSDSELTIRFEFKQP